MLLTVEVEMHSNDELLTIAWRRMAPFLARLTAKPETQAVVVLSSAARARDRLSFDAHSDFDVGLVLNIPVAPEEWCPRPWDTYRMIQHRLPRWLPNFSFHVPMPSGRLEVNVNQLIYAYEADERTEWDDAKCEAYGETARVLFDREDRFLRLVRRKTAKCREDSPTRVLRLANRLEWDIEILPRRQADRGELETAHYMVNLAISELIELCFALTGRFVPNQKWRLLVLRERRLLPEMELTRLQRALQCDPTSRSDLERRIRDVSQVWRSVRTRSAAIPNDPYRAFTAFQVQLTSETVADEMRERLGEDGYDATNYLLAECLAELVDGAMPCLGAAALAEFSE